MIKTRLNQKGITLIEVIVCVAIFGILSVSIYGVFTSIIKGITYYREKTTISSLADQYLEIVRNMPYSQIGTITGNPHGSLSDLPNPVDLVVNGISYQVYYAISYVDDPADGTILSGTDLSPNDYKQVKLYIKNVSTGAVNSFFTNVSPKGLEGLASGGALSLHVINAVGEPVPGATLRIRNTSVVPSIDLARTADANGNWVEVGLPDSANSYNIVASKNGYSVDQTYPDSASNPSPAKGDATIASGQVTAVTFQIDRLSNLILNTLNKNCGAVSGVDLEIHGSKLIGDPDVLKFNNNHTSNSAGQISLNNIEFDGYTPLPAIGSSYMVYGYAPSEYINVLPGTTQNFNLILGAKTADSLLVTVKDASTGNPLEGAQVDLQDGGDAITKFTSGSILNQQSWSGGPGQTDFSDAAQYYEDDHNINNNITPAGLSLAKIDATHYVSSGSLTSSTFDTGTDLTTYSSLTWQPTSQDPSTSIKFQISANNDNLTWNYLGPDGTAGTYYDIPGMKINNLNNNRYVRYKVFLSTADSEKTPVLTSVNINYSSGCSTPGQVMFPGLQENTYQATISLSGYQTQTVSAKVKGNSVLVVLLSH